LTAYHKRKPRDRHERTMNTDADGYAVAQLHRLPNGWRSAARS
jgi:hypothetical protein